jgi:hypothetical protein
MSTTMWILVVVAGLIVLDVVFDITGMLSFIRWSSRRNDDSK